VSATAPGSFGVSVQIVTQCVVTGTTALNFGNSVGVLTTAGGNIDQTASLTVQCTNTTPYNIGLDGGSNSGASTGVRYLNNSGATIGYTLYYDSGRLHNWGSTIGTDTVPDTGTGDPITYTVYGRVAPQTTPAPGLYTDTIHITVTY
jgi:spore coat protein U-like protein